MGDICGISNVTGWVPLLERYQGEGDGVVAK
jgi:hypothetical protein